MTDYPRLSEKEVQAEKARHRKNGLEHPWCARCTDPWPCPTIRLIAERERLREALDFSPVVFPDGGVCLHIQRGGQAVCLHYLRPSEGYDDMRALREWAERIHALAETGEKDD